LNPFPPPPQHPGTPPPTEQTATAALILGVLSLVCMGPLTGIPAIICGHVARGRIARSGGTIGGNGLAVAGMVMGYASIILLCAFIAIFARVAMKAQLQLARPAVTAKQSQLSDALVAYKADFGHYPDIKPVSGERVDMKSLIGILEGNNAKNHKYYTGGNGIEFNKLPADPWGKTLFIAIDLNGDGVVKVGDKQIPGPCAVWSSGPNKVNEDGGGDDIVSW
jgi:hypothetical protein